MTAILCRHFEPCWRQKQFETFYPGKEIICNEGQQKMAPSLKQYQTAYNH